LAVSHQSCEAHSLRLGLANPYGATRRIKPSSRASPLKVGRYISGYLAPLCAGFDLSPCRFPFAHASQYGKILRLTLPVIIPDHQMLAN